MSCANCSKADEEFVVIMYEEGKARVDVVVNFCKECKEAFEWGEARANEGALTTFTPIEQPLEEYMP